MKAIKTLIYFLLIYQTLSTSCFAYIGPGIAFGLLGGTFAVVVSILSIFFGLIWFPLRKMMKNKKKIKKKIKIFIIFIWLVVEIC